MANQARDRVAVLVVDDELLVRLYEVDALQDSGFDVSEAANADEAIRMLELRDDIRVVVTDVQMPGSMDGLRLAAVIRDRWPPIALIVTSGFFRRTDELPPDVSFIAKPFDQAVLVNAVDAALGSD